MITKATITTTITTTTHAIRNIHFHLLHKNMQIVIAIV